MISELFLVSIFIILLIVPILMGVPVFYSIGLTCLLIMLLPFGPTLNLDAFPIRMISQSQAFILLAVPFYYLAGKVLVEGGAVDAILAFSKELVGPVSGGLAYINVFASIIFSGMSGSAVADAAGLGTVEYEMMTEGGYRDDVALGVTGSSAIIGPIIPPSIPMIIYAALAGVSIGDMFLAGIIPGLIMALSIMVLVFYFARKHGYSQGDRWRMKQIISTFVYSLPALFTVVLIIGGIFFGLFTATEAGGVAVVWAILIGIVIYQDLNYKNLYKAVYEVMIDIVALMLIFAVAGVYALLIVTSGISESIVDLLLLIDDPVLVLLVVAILMLFLGMVLDPIVNIILIVPILAPNFVDLGIDPIQTGIVVIVALMIGLLTPPVGQILFVLERVTDVPFEKVTKGMLPFLVPLLVTLLLLVLFPDLSLIIPELSGN